MTTRAKAAIKRIQPLISYFEKVTVVIFYDPDTRMFCAIDKETYTATHGPTRAEAMRNFARVYLWTMLMAAQPSFAKPQPCPLETWVELQTREQAEVVTFRFGPELAY